MLGPTPHILSLVCVLAAILIGGCAQTSQTKKGDDNGDEVNVGYGTQKRGDVTGSVSTVDAEDSKDRPGAEVADMLEGRVAGVYVTRTPGGGVRIRIRGSASLYSSSEPLYVVDGIPIVPDPGGALSFLNPNDIDRIEVLKDASATAIYGSRGANGVILITTKRGTD